MKTIINTCVVAMLTIFAMTAQAQDRIIDFDQLPAPAQRFIHKHFDAGQISYIKEDSGFLSSKEYEVRLNNGKKVEFDAKGNWTEVDAKNEAVPAEIVPERIVKHVSKNFSKTKIVQIKKSSRKFEVELSNGLELEFNAKGKFLRIDD